MGMTPAERNLAVAIRSEEEGHRAFLRDGKIQVVSDTDHEIVYHVGAIGHGEGPIVFRCVPHRRGSYGDPSIRNHGDIVSPSPGVLCCKHAATAVKRLEREGLARYDEPTGLWMVPPSVAAARDEAEKVGDVFASYKAMGG